MKRRFWIGFAASVALNLFLLGFLFARSVGKPSGREARPQAFHLERALRGAEAPEVRQQMRERMRQTRPSRRELRQARRRVREALEATPYQRQELQAALEQLRDRTQNMQGQMHDALLDVADQLSPEQRRRLAEANDRPGRGQKNGPPGERPPRK